MYKERQKTGFTWDDYCHFSERLKGLYGLLLLPAPLKILGYVGTIERSFSKLRHHLDEFAFLDFPEKGINTTANLFYGWKRPFDTRFLDYGVALETLAELRARLMENNPKCEAIKHLDKVVTYINKHQAVLPSPTAEALQELNSL